MKEHDKIADELYSQDKRLSKEDRKARQAKDRSKYKKSDFEKFQEELEEQLLARADRETLLEGRVLSIRSDCITVESEKQAESTWACKLRGLIKKVRTGKKNPIAVGDIVLFEPLADSEGMIVYVKPRSSLLARADNLSQKKQQLLAANIDQVLITASVGSPPLKPTLIDRYMIAAEKGSMRPVVLINKCDLSLSEKEREELEEYTKALKAIDIPLLQVSAESGEGVDKLQKLMEGAASVFSGQSGVGKSTLINKVTGLSLKTGDVVEKTKKGSHTTTTASLLPLSFGGWVVDTPGIKSFGVWDISQEELQFYFPEFDPYRASCKFPTCTHIHEPSCAVKEAVEEEKISYLRYGSYLSLYDEVGSDFLKR